MRMIVLTAGFDWVGCNGKDSGVLKILQQHGPKVQRRSVRY